MTDIETAASAAGTMAAVCASGRPDGTGRPLPWSYTVSASAAECFATGQKWSEAFDISADSRHGGTVGGVVTITITSANKAVAVTGMDGAAIVIEGQSVLGEHLPRSDEGCVDTQAGPITNIGAGPDGVAVLAGPGAANENSGASLWTSQWSDGGSPSNFFLALIIAFYAVATVVALYSAAEGSHDAVGYLASLFVFGSFGCRTMVPLRILALASNVAFMTYAVRNQLAPVLVLHALLLPTNIVRLWQIMAKRPLTSYWPHLSRAST